MDAVLEKLYKQPLLDVLTEADLEAILPMVREKAFGAGEVVFRAGDPPENFYLITRGEFEVLRDEGEGERRSNLLYPGEFFGDIALLYDQPRGAKVRAVDDSEVLFIGKEDFRSLLDSYPLLERSLDVQGAEIQERTERRFEGQGVDEVILHFSRRHWMALISRMGRVAALLLFWFVVMLGLYAGFQGNEAAQGTAAVIGVFLLLAPAALAAWEALDWFNDYYIVTNERVIHIEEVLFFSHERYEVPLNQVQNVNVAHPNPWNEWFNYGNVIVTTAAQGGPGATLVLDQMPGADRVAPRIIQELNKERNILQQQGKDEKRRALRAALGLDPSAEAKAGPNNRAEEIPERRPSAILAFLTTMSQYLRPLMREQKGSVIIWRKHWFILLRDSLLAWLAFVVLLTGLVLVPLLLTLTGLQVALLAIVGLLLVVANLAWLWWLYEDWRNDLYILTPEAIVDEETKPLGFNKEVRRASLDKIQDTRYVQPNPIMVLLNVGDVLIQTAGQEGVFTFTWVKDPRAVQYDIFRYIQARQSQRERNEAAAINQELLEILRMYKEESDKEEDKKGRRSNGPTPPLPPPLDTPPGDSDAQTRRWPS